MFNHIGFLGRLAQELEIRYTTNGTPVASFDLAVQVPSKDKNMLPDYITFVEDRISTRKYDGGNDKRHKVVEVNASRIYFTDNKESGGGGYGDGYSR